MTELLLQHHFSGALGGAKISGDGTPLAQAVTVTANACDDGVEYRFPAGILAKTRYLTWDTIVDGEDLVTFLLTLYEAASPRCFTLSYSALNHCQARARMSMDAVNQNVWAFPREGAWLKPICGGDAIDVAQVNRISITVLRKAHGAVTWRQTHPVASTDQPPMLETPILTHGPLLDELGQSATRVWKGKCANRGEMVHELLRQHAVAVSQKHLADRDTWGGWINGPQLPPTGWFQTHNDGNRWWLVDPDGHLFWSSGLDCVNPSVPSAVSGLKSALTFLPPDGTPGAITNSGMGESADYMRSNLATAFGNEDWYVKWADLAYGFMRSHGFNTVANWSDWKTASSRHVPYVRPLEGTWKRTPLVFRDFPDVFDPAFAEDCRDWAGQLAETALDPAMIGYFLMNEPTWGFANMCPAEGMLRNTQTCCSRTMLAESLNREAPTDQDLSAKWAMHVTYAEIKAGLWTAPFSAEAQADLQGFSSTMAEKLFADLSQSCKVIDPHHLNLGARYYTVPPAWATAAMKAFDCFSFNCYAQSVPHDQMSRISNQLSLPVLVGEWHFGALDVGLPGSGIGHVASQEDRGKAFRAYVEDAVAEPCCVGVHYFTLYDESALGRFDGENWNIGLIDVCHRPYSPMTDAARLTHERLYEIASGSIAPTEDKPSYLPLLFF
jgi:hypothetical protein